MAGIVKYHINVKVNVKPAWIIQYVGELTGSTNDGTGDVPFRIESRIDIKSFDREDAREINIDGSPKWIKRSIKLYEPNGVQEMPIVNGLYTVHDGDETIIVAHWVRDPSWQDDENEGVSGIIWLEVFEGDGIGSRLRAPTIIPLTTEACFMPDSITSPLAGADITGNCLSDDIGIIGNDVYLTATIDHSKLPSGSKFTINARIYCYPIT